MEYLKRDTIVVENLLKANYGDMSVVFGNTFSNYGIFDADDTLSIFVGTVNKGQTLYLATYNRETSVFRNKRFLSLPINTGSVFRYQNNKIYVACWCILHNHRSRNIFNCPTDFDS
jgi:hypothetical protein